MKERYKLIPAMYYDSFDKIEDMLFGVNIAEVYDRGDSLKIVKALNLLDLIEERMNVAN